MELNNNPVQNSNNDATDTKSGALNVDIALASKLFEDSFNLLDRDKDKFVSQKELETAVSTTHISEEQELVFTTLAQFADEIQQLSRDEFLTDISGISRADMKKLSALDGQNGNNRQDKLHKDVSERLARGLDVHDPDVFRDVALKHFGKIDLNGSGSLDRLELENFVKDEETEEKERDVASVILEHFDDMTNMSRPEYVERGQAKALGFYRYDHQYGAEVSVQDIRNLPLLRLTPQAEIDSAKSGEYLSQRIQGGMLFVASGACAGVGVAAMFSPEPISKAPAAGAIGLGLMGAAAGGAMAFSRKHSNIELVYSEIDAQRNAMNKWNYFNR